MTEEFDALRTFDLAGMILIGALLLVVALIAEGGIRFLRRWAQAIEWRYVVVVLNALTWQLK